MSLRRPILNLSLRIFEKPFLRRVERPEDLREVFERKARLWFRGPRGIRYSDDVLRHGEHAVNVHWAEAPGATRGPVILYFHGGGFVFGSSRTHRAMLARLSALTGLSACLPDYRLAPEHPFPAALEDALTAYRSIEGPVVLGGDSAGGGLALALLAEIRAQGLHPPLGCFLFSPLTDMTFSGASFAANASADALLPNTRAGEMAQMYLQDHDPRDPRASPLFADFTGAPPVWITVGDTEILLDDTRRMAERLRRHGVEVDEVIEHDLPHVWPIFQRLLPEADATLARVANWITSLSRPRSGS